MNIPRNQISILNSYRLDKVGYLFKWKNKLYRAISANYEEYILNLFKSGLIKELCDKGLFVPTKISEHKLRGCKLLIEHELIKNITYPQEWSFEMFKDAAVCTLEVNLIANKYGYQTIDAHPNNITFRKLKPIFLDLGSFVKKEKKFNTWFASEEFIKSFVYPLELWASNLLILSNSLIKNSTNPISHEEFLLIKYPIFKYIPIKYINFISSKYFTISRITSIPDNLIEKRINPLHFKIYLFLKRNNLIPLQKFSLEDNIKRIKNLKHGKQTYWSGYQSNEETFIPTNRFKVIKKKLKQKKVKSILDIAGNQGFFSEYLIDEKAAETVYCLDYDLSAINQLYLRLKNKGKSITPIVQNAIFPKNNYNEMLPEERFKSEAVLALALTHHLMLMQYIPLEIILKKISSFSKNYVFIEYMPLGLWNGKYTLPVPNWYTEKYFENEFKRLFLLDEIIKLEKNRILYIGRKRKNLSFSETNN